MVRGSKIGSVGNKTYMSLSVAKHNYQVHNSSRGKSTFTLPGAPFSNRAWFFCLFQSKTYFKWKNHIAFIFVPAIEVMKYGVHLWMFWMATSPWNYFCWELKWTFFQNSHTVVIGKPLRRYLGRETTCSWKGI